MVMSMKRFALLILVFVITICLCACGSTAPAAVEAPEMETAPAEEAPAMEEPPVAEAAPAMEEPPVEEDPLRFVRYDWKPTQEQVEELYNYALPYIKDQPYFVHAEFLYGNNYIVHVNCNPADLDDSIIPFMQAVRDKFYEMREDVHDIIYILFVNDSEAYSYPVSYSVEDVP